MPTSRISSRLASRLAEADIEDAARQLGKKGKRGVADDEEERQGGSRRLGRARRAASRGVTAEMEARGEGGGEEAERARPPPDWQEMYRLVQQMRSPGGVAHPAPVDMMGCERLADAQASPLDRRFQTLVALMLSSQTQDGLVARAMRRLKTELPGHQAGAAAGLNLDNLLAAQPELLRELIGCVGFPTKKTKYLKAMAEALRRDWRGDIPDSIEGLMSLAGVGNKMAYLAMSVAWGRTLGIGVDTHVARITGKIWAWHDRRTPDEARRALESWLPRDKWSNINWLLVGFGQTVCLPRGSRCGDCELGLRSLCKAAVADKVRVGRLRRQRQQQQQQQQQEGTKEDEDEEPRPGEPRRLPLRGYEAKYEPVDIPDARGGQADTSTVAATSGRVPDAMRRLRSASKR